MVCYVVGVFDLIDTLNGHRRGAAGQQSNVSVCSCDNAIRVTPQQRVYMQTEGSGQCGEWTQYTCGLAHSKSSGTTATSKVVAAQYMANKNLFAGAGKWKGTICRWALCSQCGRTLGRSPTPHECRSRGPFAFGSPVPVQMKNPNTSFIVVVVAAPSYKAASTAAQGAQSR